MKRLGLVAIFCGWASFAAAPAGAFDIQGQNANLQDGAPAGAKPFTSPIDQYLTGEYDYTKGNSLALPYIGKGDSSSSLIPEYGNMISIPGPGVSQPAPAWAYR